MGRVLIDTDVIIGVLRKKPIEFSKEALKRIEKGEFEGFISVLTVFELYIGARINPKPEKAMRAQDACPIIASCDGTEARFPLV